MHFKKETNIMCVFVTFIQKLKNVSQYETMKVLKVVEKNAHCVSFPNKVSKK